MKHLWSVYILFVDGTAEAIRFSQEEIENHAFRLICDSDEEDDTWFKIEVWNVNEHISSIEYNYDKKIWEKCS